jgi:benzil reductase ((S)-benzoin forming)
MYDIVWVSGASSGIGRAFIDAIPDRDARAICIARRPSPRAEHLRADLSDPASWRVVADHFDETLGSADYGNALFFHCAGTILADGPVLRTDAADYTSAVLLNSASGQVLGRAFLVAASRNNCRATLVMCSSPASTDAYPGLSHYCGGKAALEHWCRAVGEELGDGANVFSVVPTAIDTPMVRGLMAEAADVPVGGLFIEAEAEGALVPPADAAQAIWAGIQAGVPQGGTLDVGATHLRARA